MIKVSKLINLMRKNLEFTAIIERDEDGYYVAEVPDLKGCYTQGKTLEEVMRNIREVIKMCLEAEGVRDLPKKELVAVQRIQLTR
jgi:predicted RNase H-like HicB family nuclease